MVPRWPARLWAAAAGMVAALAWQVGAGADGLLAGGGHVPSAVGALDEGSSPASAADALWQPLADLEIPPDARQLSVYGRLSPGMTTAGAQAAPWRMETLAALDALAKAHRGLAVPKLAGSGVALKRG